MTSGVFWSGHACFLLRLTRKTPAEAQINSIAVLLHNGGCLLSLIA